MGKLRGLWHDYEGIPLLVTYHPAALLRNPAYKKETWEDMQKLKARYDELES
jgi:uracil-DNA glycosylase family 4